MTTPTVVACYSVFDYFFPACGFTDLTEGVYDGDPSRPYDVAQVRQADMLLDRAGVVAGGRLLDVGCGYGRLLRAAAGRGATARGITVSPEQVRRGTRSGLDVRLLDYKRIGSDWNGRFDAVIANGSVEHFAQPADALAGKADEVYRHLFATVRRLLDPAKADTRFVTTAIHFRGAAPTPGDLLRPPSAFPSGSPAFHWARLALSFGGWYPVPGQLERCAAGQFRLVHEEDATEDYRRTSEAWLGGVRAAMRSWRLARIGWSVLLRRPRATVRLLACVMGSESWNWQFRGDPAPTIHLRQTWERLPG